MCGSIPYVVQFILSGIVLCVAVFQIAIVMKRTFLGLYPPV